MAEDQPEVVDCSAVFRPLLDSPLALEDILGIIHAAVHAEVAEAMSQQHPPSTHVSSAVLGPPLSVLGPSSPALVPLLACSARYMLLSCACPNDLKYGDGWLISLLPPGQVLMFSSSGCCCQQ